MKRFRLIEEHSRQYDKETQPEQWEADRVDYIVCVRECMRRPLNPHAGTDYEEMAAALRVLKQLDGKKLGDILELEDADHANLAERARTQRWSVNDDRLVRFVMTIVDAGEWPLDATEKERGSTLEPTINGSNGRAFAGRLDGDRKQVRARH